MILVANSGELKTLDEFLLTAGTGEEQGTEEQIHDLQQQIQRLQAQIVRDFQR
jgi:hypothetical protein